jgi:hypothetical protein
MIGDVVVVDGVDHGERAAVEEALREAERRRRDEADRHLHDRTGRDQVTGAGRDVRAGTTGEDERKEEKSVPGGHVQRMASRVT